MANVAKEHMVDVTLVDGYWSTQYLKCGRYGWYTFVLAYVNFFCNQRKKGGRVLLGLRVNRLSHYIDVTLCKV